jgi:hypothetical protein
VSDDYDGIRYHDHNDGSSLRSTLEETRDARRKTLFGEIADRYHCSGCGPNN